MFFYKIFEKIDSSEIGDVMSRKKFLSYIKKGYIINYDGYIGSVLVNGFKTNFYVIDWGGYSNDDSEKIQIKELKKIDGAVEIVWCNR